MTISALKIVIVVITALLLLGSVQVAHAEVLLPVNVNGQFGYINTSGQVVIAPQFDSAQEFSEGLAVVGKKECDGSPFRVHRRKGSGEDSDPVPECRFVFGGTCAGCVP